VPRYRIVPERSCVWIDAKSSVHPIHSSTEGLEGHVEIEIASGGSVDLEVTPAGELSLPVSRLSSGNRMEDRELQKRIDSRRFPTIKGVIDQVKPSDGDGNYTVSGEITFRGVSRRYEDDMTIRAVDGQTIQLVGRSSFDIRDFGMEPPRILMLKVDPQVAVRVEIFAVNDA
jgi:polyisoprenoid-binding protein YceI